MKAFFSLSLPEVHDQCDPLKAPSKRWSGSFVRVKSKQGCCNLNRSWWRWHTHTHTHTQSTRSAIVYTLKSEVRLCLHGAPFATNLMFECSSTYGSCVGAPWTQKLRSVLCWKSRDIEGALFYARVGQSCACVAFWRELCLISHLSPFVLFWLNRIRSLPAQTGCVSCLGLEDHSN